MDQILKDFGVQPILLLAQVVNFLVLLYILKRLLYKPILNVLEKRRQTIAQSLKKAEEIEKRLAQTEQEKEKKLIQAAKEAQAIINEATKTAEGIIQEAHLTAQKEMEKMLEKGTQTIKVEKEKMQQEIREELSEMVVISLKKVISDSLDIKKQQEIISQAIKRI